MEMVKVDIQKLQLLNDRIAQTIEALNQVRMSMQVQGIQHTPFTQYGYPTTPFGFPQPQQQQAYGQPFAPVPYGVQTYGTYGTPWTPSPFGGIQHTTVPPWSIPYTGNGISHTTWDPTWQTRATTMQAWPFTLS